MSDVVITAPAGRVRMRLRPAGSKLLGFGLLLPCLVFVLAFFVWPIASMLSRAVYSPEVEVAMPATIVAMGTWRDDQLPPAAVGAALLDDLAQADRAALANAGRRLNYEKPGYRTLLLKTARDAADAPRDDPMAVLAEIDEKWADPGYWIAMRRASSALTSYYLLTAVDMRQTDDGSIARVPEGEALFTSVLGRTLWMSAVVTVICALIAFPLAYTVTSAPKRWQSILLLLVLLPFWTSLLVRSSAWVIILQEKGMLNALLMKLHLIDAPLQLIFNRTGVYIALVHVMLPFMVLPISNTMRSISPDYVRAAFSLGASAPRTLFRVYLPMVWPGIAAGALLTFVICVGYYVTPLLVGGSSDQMLSYFIAFYTNETVNWGLASALAILLCVCLLGLLGLYALLPRRGPVVTKG